MPPLINSVAMLGTAGLIYTLLCVGSPVISRAEQDTGSKPTIAAVTAGVDDLDKVRSLYGNGAETSVQDIRGLCYYVEQDRAYLSVSSFEHENRVQSVTLTTFADVAPRCRAATITGKHLTALHGIGLGDSMAEVQIKSRPQLLPSQKNSCTGRQLPARRCPRFCPQSGGFHRRWMERLLEPHAR